MTASTTMTAILPPSERAPMVVNEAESAMTLGGGGMDIDGLLLDVMEEDAAMVELMLLLACTLALMDGVIVVEAEIEDVLDGVAAEEGEMEGVAVTLLEIEGVLV
jgi:hypothetical protein